MSISFRPREEFEQAGAYRLLPFRFARLRSVDRVLVTADTGEFALLRHDEFSALIDRRLEPSTPIYRDLVARGFIDDGSAKATWPLKVAQLRTRKAFIEAAPSLHIFVLTLRCDHSCVYCQVSRQNVGASSRFDMSAETAAQAVERIFESPSRDLTVEFQGGEPALAFERLREVVAAVEKRNEEEGRRIQFTLVSTLHHLDDERLAFLAEHGFHLSTSIDGPTDLHNANRPLQGRDAWQRTVAGLERARAVLGHDRIAALTTLTRRSLSQPREIVDTYVALGFRSVFLRPLSPYGFALKTATATGYAVEEFLGFYREALAYMLDLNAAGVEIEEVYTSILLQHILTPYASGYMDLRSPAGAGLGALVYNYDGRVFASDEGRMLAETDDDRFVLGTCDQPLSELLASDAMRWTLAAGVAELLPGCHDCAYQPFCGADPVFHAGQQGDPVGHRPSSNFCKKHMGLFDHLFGLLAQEEPETMRTLIAWAFRRSRGEVVSGGIAA